MSDQTNIENSDITYSVLNSSALHIHSQALPLAHIYLARTEGFYNRANPKDESFLLSQAYSRASSAVFITGGLFLCLNGVPRQRQP